jgi:hypothetical protein
VRLMMFLTTLALLSGCESASPVSDYCTIYEPIYSSLEDTEETKRQIDRENVKFLAVCEGIQPL